MDRDILQLTREKKDEAITIIIKNEKRRKHEQQQKKKTHRVEINLCSLKLHPRKFIEIFCWCIRYKRFGWK